MAHVVTSVGGNSYTQIGGGLSTCTNSVDAGTGSNRVILVTHYRRIDRAMVINSVTIGGEAMTILGSDQLLSGNYYCRTFALVNPTVTGTQDLVITSTTNGSNSVGDVIVKVYDNVDPNVSASSLLTNSESQSIVSPWTGFITEDVPSATGYQAVASLYATSNDVSYNLNESGFVERYWSIIGGIARSCGDTDGASSVEFRWDIANLNQDCGVALFGFSLPPPSSGGLFAIRQFSNGRFQSTEFVESAGLYPALRIASNASVQLHEMIEESGRTTHQINTGGVYRCAEFIETN